jgi:hypothetical protein
MTMDDAVEAGLLVQAIRLMPELISDVEAEATGELEAGQTRWPTLCLELWGQNSEEDSNKDHIGEGVPLPLIFTARLLGVMKREIEARLDELGVVQSASVEAPPETLPMARPVDHEALNAMGFKAGDEIEVLVPLPGNSGIPVGSRGKVVDAKGPMLIALFPDTAGGFAVYVDPAHVGIRIEPAPAAFPARHEDDDDIAF